MAVDCLLVGSGQRVAGVGGRLPDSVEFGKPSDLGDQRQILTRARIDTVDLGERELQPVGLLSHLTRTVGAVDEVTACNQPLIA